MLLTNGTIVTPGVRRRTIQRQVSFGPVTLRVVTIIVIAAAAVVALAQSTTAATKNYKAEELKAEVKTAQKDIEERQFEAARLQSLQAITQTASPSPSPVLEQAKEINFLPGSSNSSISQLPDSVTAMP